MTNKIIGILMGVVIGLLITGSILIMICTRGGGATEGATVAHNFFSVASVAFATGIIYGLIIAGPSALIFFLFLNRLFHSKMGKTGGWCFGIGAGIASLFVVSTSVGFAIIFAILVSVFSGAGGSVADEINWG